MKNDTEPKVKKIQKKEYIQTLGRRRSAVARVRLYADIKDDSKWGEREIKKGEILVNNKSLEDYFRNPVSQSQIKEPLRVTNMHSKFAVTIQVAGGGLSGQAGAAALGISRALVAFDKDKHRTLLKKKGHLIRDPRVRERRKVGTGGKARRKKQSPKR